MDYKYVDQNGTFISIKNLTQFPSRQRMKLAFSVRKIKHYNCSTISWLSTNYKAMSKWRFELREVAKPILYCQYCGAGPFLTGSGSEYFFHRLRLRNTVSTYCWMLTLSEIMCDKTTCFSWDTIPLNEKKQFISIFLRCICKICILELF